MIRLIVSRILARRIQCVNYPGLLSDCFEKALAPLRQIVVLNDLKQLLLALDTLLRRHMKCLA
ncbi:hypothetical protein D3C71_1886790 [compost metagenome]